MVGGPQLLIILVIVLLLFGGAKLPSLARSIGQAQKEFQKGLKEGVNTSGDDEEAEADGKDKALSASEREELDRLRREAKGKDSTKS